MIGDVIGILMSFWMWIADLVRQPTSAFCPGGLYVNGVRPSGIYECVFDDPTKVYVDCRGSRRCEPPPPSPLDFSFRGRIYCTPPLIPMHDGVRIWCGRGHYQGTMRRELQERSARLPWQGYPARVCVQRGANQRAFGARARHGARRTLRGTL